MTTAHDLKSYIEAHATAVDTGAHVADEIAKAHEICSELEERVSAHAQRVLARIEELSQQISGLEARVSAAEALEAPLAQMAADVHTLAEHLGQLEPQLTALVEKEVSAAAAMRGEIESAFETVEGVVEAHAVSVQVVLENHLPALRNDVNSRFADAGTKVSAAVEIARAVLESAAADTVPVVAGQLVAEMTRGREQFAQLLARHAEELITRHGAEHDTVVTAVDERTGVLQGTYSDAVQEFTDPLAKARDVLEKVEPVVRLASFI